MYNTRTFQEVLSAVTGITEIEQDAILSPTKREDVVDARALLIYTLYEKGLYPCQISRLTGFCPRRVAYFIADFISRVNSRKILRIYYESIKKKLGLN